ncbi:2510_t:CDS:2, partial [Ambispora leptoticha]
NPRDIMSLKEDIKGHSQGASMALAVGLTSDYPLAGIIAENKITPFFLYHNYYDEVIPVWVGNQSADLLKEKGYQVEFEGEYSGSHFFQPEELQEILTKKLNALRNVGETFAAAGGATPTENPETTTGTHPTGTEETGNTSEPETTGTPPEPATTGASAQTPEPNTTPPPKPISVYDYFETKSGLINEDHVDSQRKFIKYGFLKNKLKEIYPQSQGSQNGNPPPGGDESTQTRKNAIQTITAALNLEPIIKESELSAEFQD